jgi:hypothetical protein
MSYIIVVIDDGKESWKKYYNNCIDAVDDFKKFQDVGTAEIDRTITLIEPNDKLHTKTFIRPGLEGKLFLSYK